MERVVSNEKKDLIPTAVEEMGGDTNDMKREVKGELTNGVQSLNNSDLQREEKNLQNETTSFSIQKEDQNEVLSGVQTSNSSDGQREDLIPTAVEEMGGDTNDMKREAKGELTNGVQSLNNSDLQREEKNVQSETTSSNIQKEDQNEVLSGVQTSNSSDGQKEDQGEPPSEVRSLNNDIQGDGGEVSNRMQCSDNYNIQREVPSGTQSSESGYVESEEQRELPSDVQSSNNSNTQKDHAEMPNEMQSSNNSDVGERELSSKMQSMNNDLQIEEQEAVPSGKQSSNNSDIEGDHPHETQSLKGDLQGEDQGEVPSETQLLSNTTLHKEDQRELSNEMQSLSDNRENHNQQNNDGLDDQTSVASELKPENPEDQTRSLEEIICEEKVVEPIFDGTEDPELEANRSFSTNSSDFDPEAQGSGWSDKAVAIKNYVREKSVGAVSTVISALSGRTDEDGQIDPKSEEKNDSPTSSPKDENDLNPDIKPKDVSQRSVERSWNPLSYIKLGREVDIENNTEQGEVVCTPNSLLPPPLKGRIMLYTRLGCQDCREIRLFLHRRRLRYVEINVDVYPSRKLELEKYTGSSTIPMVFFNELPIGGLNVLMNMEESGELKEKISDLFTKEPPREAPVPPLSGEDDESCSGPVDELALIVKKMRESILVKDRFCRMRRFSNCFVGSEAVDFLAADQLLERKQAIEFGQKLASKHFFRHVLEENVFEDGNHLYRFLDHDPIVSSQCYNTPRGIIDAKPKPIIDIASRLRFLSWAMFEAYASVNGRHVDYRSIHGSEEFARYLRVVEELQRVEILDMSREEKLAFFINLYNTMAIHAILTWGYPGGPLERRKMLGDFKYVIGGYTYSLSAIENGILRCNQRPPYNLVKPFGIKDQRAKVALPYPEPLIHFALVTGNRSGPALRCYTPNNIDKELMEAARNFLRNGGIVLDPETKVVSVSKILRWYSADFGKSEVEVLKHAANYLETEKSEELLELLANTQVKVVYQPYDWAVNC